MPCFHPLQAHQTMEGDIHFYQRGTQGKRGKAPNYRRDLKLPCGRCVGCRLERSRQTAVRLMHEAQLHEENSFITLTLSDDYLLNGRASSPSLTARPSSPPLSEGQHTEQRTREKRTYDDLRPDSLNKRELQLFTKRLNENVRRVRGSARGVKYYACGEYGDSNDRPHYHIAVFGEEFSGDRYKWRRSNGNQLWRSPRLEALWPHGQAEIGELTFNSAAYIARYIMKKITGKLADEHYKRTDASGTDYWIQPEFNVMSRGGRTGKGIGHAWFQTHREDVYGGGDYVVINGKKCKPPRYYDKLLEALAPMEHEAITQAREMAGNGNPADQTPERLAVAETVTIARLNQYKRSLE